MVHKESEGKASPHKQSELTPSEFSPSQIQTIQLTSYFSAEFHLLFETVEPHYPDWDSEYIHIQCNKHFNP